MEEKLKTLIKNCKNDTCIFNTKDYILYEDVIKYFQLSKEEPTNKDIEVNLIGFAYQYDVCESKEEKVSLIETFVSNIRNLF